MFSVGVVARAAGWGLGPSGASGLGCTGVARGSPKLAIRLLVAFAVFLCWLHIVSL